MRSVGTVVRGIRTPIIKKGDDLLDLVVQSLLDASQNEGFTFHDRDVVGVTESVLARSQGNYATTDQIAADVRAKFPGGEAVVLFPILSRNRFAILLRGIARGLNKLYIQLSYPSDEVGNPLFSPEQLDDVDVDPSRDVLTEEQYRGLFGYVAHPFTGIDYVSYYKEIAPNATIYFANDARAALRYSKHVIACDIHTRAMTKRRLTRAGALTAIGLDDLLTAPVSGGGYNPEYGLLGSNKAGEETVKLFPRDCAPFVSALSERLLSKTGKHIEVMVYGDGAFKDPVGKIWELADPVVSPAFTPGLSGTPSEIKLKYYVDNAPELQNVTGAAAEEQARALIRGKQQDMTGHDAAQGTTPRQYTDLLGSLCDLTSGSGDKGTPVVLVQGYFDNYGN